MVGNKDEKEYLRNAVKMTGEEEEELLLLRLWLRCLCVALVAAEAEVSKPQAAL